MKQKWRIVFLLWTLLCLGGCSRGSDSILGNSDVTKDYLPGNIMVYDDNQNRVAYTPPSNIKDLSGYYKGKLENDFVKLEAELTVTQEGYYTLFLVAPATNEITTSIASYIDSNGNYQSDGRGTIDGRTIFSLTTGIIQPQYSVYSLYSLAEVNYDIGTLDNDSDGKIRGINFGDAYVTTMRGERAVMLSGREFTNTGSIDVTQMSEASDLICYYGIPLNHLDNITFQVNNNDRELSDANLIQSGKDEFQLKFTDVDSELKLEKATPESSITDQSVFQHFYNNISKNRQPKINNKNDFYQILKPDGVGLIIDQPKESDSNDNYNIVKGHTSDANYNKMWEYTKNGDYSNVKGHNQAGQELTMKYIIASEDYTNAKNSRKYSTFAFSPFFGYDGNQFYIGLINDTYGTMEWKEYQLQIQELGNNLKKEN